MLQPLSLTANGPAV